MRGQNEDWKDRCPRVPSDMVPAVYFHKKGQELFLYLLALSHANARGKRRLSWAESACHRAPYPRAPWKTSKTGTVSGLRTTPGVRGTHETAQQVLALTRAGHRHDDRRHAAGGAPIHADAGAAAGRRRRAKFHTDIPGDGAAAAAGAEPQGGAAGYASVHAQR